MKVLEGIVSSSGSVCVCSVAGAGDGGGSSSRSGCGDRLLAEVVTVLKPHRLPFCYQATGSLLSWEMPGALGPILRVTALQYQHQSITQASGYLTVVYGFFCCFYSQVQKLVGEERVPLP